MNQERQRLILEHIDAVVYMVQAAENKLEGGTVQFVSPRVKSILGYEASDFLNDPALWFRIVCPEDIPALQESTGQIFSTRQPGTRRYRLRHKQTGEYRWMEDRVVPQLDNAGNVSGIFGIARDITGRKQVEESLRESEAQFQRLAENARDIIYRYRLGPTRRFEYVSPACMAITGYTPEEHYADPDLGMKMVHPDDRPALEKYFRQEGIFGKPIVLRWVRKDGTLIWMEQRNVPIFDKGGNLIAVESIARDITRRKETEDRMIVLNHRLQQLVEAIQKLAMARDLESVIGVVRSAARRLTDADGSTFVLREGDHCFYADEDAVSPLWKGQRFPMSTCISGWVMINHQPAVIEDIYTDPRIPAVAYRPTFVKSLAMVPIRSQDPLGAIGNYWAHSHAPTPEEVQLLQTLADATAIAMENIQLYHEQEQRLAERKRAQEAMAERSRQQGVVAELGHLALAGRDLQWLFDHAVTRVAENFGVEYCKVLELLPDGSALKLVAGVGWKEGLIGQATVGVGPDSQAGFTLLSRNPVIVEDLRTETRFSGPPLLRDHGIVSGLSVIIGELETPFGVMGAHTTHRRAFTPDDVHFFQSVANVLAVAIQRGRAEAALRENEELFRQLSESSPLGILLMDPPGGCAYCNPHGRAVFGVTVRESIGEGWARFIHPEDREEVLTEWLAAARKSEGYAREFRLKLADGVVRSIHFRSATILGDAGDLRGHVATVENITERKKNEEALQRSERRFALFMQHLPGAAWLKDAQGRYEYANPIAERIYRSPLPDVIGKTDDELFPPEQAAQCKASDRRVIETGKCVQTIETVPQADGVHYSEVNKFPILDAAGTLILVGGMAFDTTERQRAEQVRDRLVQQLRAANHKLHRLSHQLIHAQEEERRRIARELHDETGQALTALHLRLQHALDSSETELILAPIEDCIALTNRILCQVRDTAHALRPSVLDDLGLIPALRWLVQQQAELGKWTAEFLSDPIEGRWPPNLEITCFRIVQEALTNIVRHAHARSVSVSLRQCGRELHLLIRDDGIGFDPNSTSEGAAQRISAGLSGMQERAHLLNGGLTIDSTPQRGTVIRVRLPISGTYL